MGYKGIINAKGYTVVGVNRFYIFLGNIKMIIRNNFRYLYKDKSDFITLYY